jgi:hypothetical protein
VVTNEALMDVVGHFPGDMVPACRGGGRARVRLAAQLSFSRAFDPALAGVFPAAG